MCMRVHMRAYVYMCMCIRVRVCMFINARCIRTFVFAYTRSCMRLCLCVKICVCTRVCAWGVYVHVCVFVCVLECMYMCV